MSNMQFDDGHNKPSHSAINSVDCYNDKTSHCTKNLIHIKFTQFKYNAKKLNGEWCKVRLSQGQRWQIPHLLMNLQPHVNWYANAVFTIFAFDFFLVSSSLYQVCPEQICVNLICLAGSYLNL